MRNRNINNNNTIALSHRTWRPSRFRAGGGEAGSEANDVVMAGWPDGQHSSAAAALNDLPIC